MLKKLTIVLLLTLPLQSQTKHDINTYTSGNLPASRVTFPSGLNNQCLVKDSTQTLGMKWVDCVAISTSGDLTSKSVNGTLNVDAYASAQAAADTLTSGGHAHVPKGTRNFAGLVQNYSGLEFSGDGIVGTVFNYTGTGSAFKTSLGSGVSARLRLHDFTVEGNGQAGVNPQTGPCFEITNATPPPNNSPSDFVLKNLRAHFCGITESGFKVFVNSTDPAISNVYGIVGENLQGSSAGNAGLHLGGHLGIPLFDFHNSVFEANNYGILINGTANGSRNFNSIIHTGSICNNNLQGNGLAALQIDAASLAGTICNNYTELTQPVPAINTQNGGQFKGVLMFGNKLGTWSTNPPAYVVKMHWQSGVGQLLSAFANQLGACTVSAYDISGFAGGIVGFSDVITPFGSASCKAHFNWGTGNPYGNLWAWDAVNNSFTGSSDGVNVKHPRFGVGVRGWNTYAIKVTNTSLTGNRATYTVSAADGLQVGESVVIAGSTHDATFNGTKVIDTIPSGTSFTVLITHADIASAADVATATPVHSNGLSAMFHVGPQKQPSAVSSGSGNADNAEDAMLVQGGTGGNITSTGTGKAGKGANVTIGSGVGGTAVAAGTNGDGGDIILKIAKAGAGAGSAGTDGRLILQDSSGSAKYADGCLQVTSGVVSSIACAGASVNFMTYSAYLTGAYNATSNFSNFHTPVGHTVTVKQITFRNSVAQAAGCTTAPKLEVTDNTMHCGVDVPNSTAVVDAAAFATSGSCTLAADTQYIVRSVAGAGCTTAPNGTGIVTILVQVN